MPMTTQLYMSLLAMDSYNRGYKQGLDVVAAGASATQIGNATLGIKSDVSISSAEYAAGFFAQSYTLNGQKVISYRGTDFMFTPPWSDNPGGDLWNGYGTAIGRPYDDQARMAAEFYQTVTGTQTTAPASGSATLTGHSLGGGLAGLIGSIYNQQTYLFDNMPFERAANSLSIDSVSNAQLRQDFYNNLSAPTPVIGNNHHAFATTGEFLYASRLLQSTAVASLDSNGGLRSPVALHSMALHTLLQYAATQANTDWYAVGRQLWDAGFNVAIADAAKVGLTNITGEYTSEYKMLTALAYSVIDEGTRVFGDVGVRAMFNDANDLGKVVKLSDASKSIIAAQGALAEMLVQFAGSMAFRKVLMSTNPGAENGVLSVDANTTTLTVDFSNALWGIGGAVPTVIPGKTTLTDEAFARIGTNGFADTRTGMNWLWNVNTSDIIDRMTFAAKNTGTTFTIGERAIPSPTGVTLFAAGGGNDTITGSSGRDFIVWGACAANDNAVGSMRLAA
jgi:hypothetical protein